MRCCGNLDALIVPQEMVGLKSLARCLQVKSRQVMLKHMKRTTLILDPALHAELKRRAAAERRTFTDVLERTLRLGLDASRTVRRARVVLPSYDLGPYLVDPGSRDTRPGAPADEDDRP